MGGVSSQVIRLVAGNPEFELVSIGSVGIAATRDVDALVALGGATVVAGGNIPGLISDVLPLFASGYAARTVAPAAPTLSSVPSSVPCRAGV